ncbi:MAG: M24 family metallopeptidase [Nitrospinota bacterium]
MQKEVISRQRAAMAEAGVDALVAISPENFAYTAGFVVPSQPLMRWRHAMAVVTRDGREAIVSVDMEESTVRSRAGQVEVRVWGEFTDRPMAALAQLLKDQGLAEALIGIEMDYLPAGDFDHLKGLLPKARFAPAEQLYGRLRQLKTQGEIDLLRRLSRITDQAVGEALGAVGAGLTEMDLAAALTKAIYARGAEQFKLMIIATGERSEYPNVGPTHRVLRPGDLCRVEIFGVIGGYHAAVCRTAVVQRASAEAERIWRNLIECRSLVLDGIKPGAGARAIYEAFLKKFRELGLPPISFVGHGIGLHLHEEPYLGKYTDSPLEAGMVLGIEPLVFGVGKGFGLQCKDMVLVTQDGCEVLSDQTPNDRLIVIP